MGRVIEKPGAHDPVQDVIADDDAESVPMLLIRGGPR
jgi:hypothetical protein